jgi:hypothetical protein
MNDKQDGWQRVAGSFLRRAATVAVVCGTLTMLATRGASVSLNASQPQTYVPCGSELEIKIISVKVRRRSRDAAEVAFQVAAKGATPVSFTKSQVQASLTWPAGTPSYRGNKFRFAKKTPEKITVSPGQPKILALNVVGGFGPPDEWRELKPGKFGLQVWIRNDSKGQAEFDYHWLGIALSEPYPVDVE